MRSGLQRRDAPQGRAARRVPGRAGRRAARARLGARQAPRGDVDPRRRQLHQGEPRQEADPHDRHPRDRRRLAARQRLVALGRPLARIRALRGLAGRLDRATRAPLRHRLACGQLADERPLRGRRARRRDLRPGGLHQGRIHSIREARRLARAALRHPGRPEAHHRPLAGAGPERSCAPRRVGPSHRSRPTLEVGLLPAPRASVRLPRPLCAAHPLDDDRGRRHADRDRALARDDQGRGAPCRLPRRRRGALERLAQAVCVRSRTRLEHDPYLERHCMYSRCASRAAGAPPGSAGTCASSTTTSL